MAILARCLRDFPRFNASISADGKSLIFKRYVHIGIAVDTPHGLIVPVIRDSDKNGIPELSLELLDVSERARVRRVRPEEFGGASMTISSLGGIGGEAFTPIINPPEVAILGISQAGMRPVWDGAAFSPTKVVPLDLSYDHRVINGADAARFLKRYCELVRNPDDLLTRTMPITAWFGRKGPRDGKGQDEGLRMLQNPRLCRVLAPNLKLPAINGCNGLQSSRRHPDRARRTGRRGGQVDIEPRSQS